MAPVFAPVPALKHSIRRPADSKSQPFHMRLNAIFMYSVVPRWVSLFSTPRLLSPRPYMSRMSSSSVTSPFPLLW